MIDLYLFEIKCAEEIGDYRLADALDNKLIKIASSSHRDILRKINRKVKNEDAIKDVSFSQTKNKFIVKAKPFLSSTVKKKIKDMAGPYSVSFRYSSKGIDGLMGDSEDPMDRHLDALKQRGPEHIGLDALDDMEPSEEELRYTAEFPADDIDEDPEGLDAFLLDFARKNMKDLGY